MSFQISFQLRIIYERHKEPKQNQLTAVKNLYRGLCIMKSQTSCIMNGDSKPTTHCSFLLYCDDFAWLRRHFHENCHLFSAKTYECYKQTVADIQTRPRLLDLKTINPNMVKFILPGPVYHADLTRLLLAVKEELAMLDPDADIPEE